MKYSTQYLYNLKPSQLTTMLYPDALAFKIASARTLIAELLELHYTVRDDQRINAIHKAISFNTKLLEELK